MARRLNLLGPGLVMTVLGQDLTKLLPRDLNATVTQQQRAEINHMMHRFYTGQKGPFYTVSTLQFLRVKKESNCQKASSGMILT